MSFIINSLFNFLTTCGFVFVCLKIILMIIIITLAYCVMSLQANNSLSLAAMKLALLRLSLDFRLRELPWDHGKGTRLEALRQELLDGGASTSPMFRQSYAGPSTTSRSNLYLTVAKPAALTGTLQIRFVSSSWSSSHAWK